MKQLVYILFTVLLIGCANVSEEKSFATSDTAETELDEASSIPIEEAFSYATITEQKLQEYFDLLVLKNKHPELAETISAQLRQITTDSILLSREQDSVAVKNLSALGPLVKINDTLQEQSFLYTIASKNLSKTDTLTAHIITKPIRIDGIETLATKVVFRKN
ncbi:hypothetical protein [Rasiella sp. SM2506]|uniref:hypothetical protein n=1 Tax=Rasiella sp. SM2506 TaxID=3423914 RepID=UPI003D7C0168